MEEAWINGLLGGLCIGLAAAMLLVTHGRVMGISGIASGWLFESGGRTWRGLILVGILLGAGLFTGLFGLPEMNMLAELPQLVLAGLLVGFGARYGSGCTSGHGVCGLARLSKRSLVATLTFMGAGIITVFLLGRLS